MNTSFFDKVKNFFGFGNQEQYTAMLDFLENTKDENHTKVGTKLPAAGIKTKVKPTPKTSKTSQVAKVIPLSNTKAPLNKSVSKVISKSSAKVTKPKAKKS